MSWEDLSDSELILAPHHPDPPRKTAEQKPPPTSGAPQTKDKDGAAGAACNPVSSKPIITAKEKKTIVGRSFVALHSKWMADIERRSTNPGAEDALAKSNREVIEFRDMLELTDRDAFLARVIELHKKNNGQFKTALDFGARNASRMLANDGRRVLVLC